jgi:hypothetical protein
MKTNQLHAAIMNLPLTVPTTSWGVYEEAAYRVGFKAARHAAVELVLTERENVNAELLAALRMVVAATESRALGATGFKGTDAITAVYAAIARAESGQSDV